MCVYLISVFVVIYIHNWLQAPARAAALRTFARKAAAESRGHVLLTAWCDRNEYSLFEKEKSIHILGPGPPKFFGCTAPRRVQILVPPSPDSGSQNYFFSEKHKFAHKVVFPKQIIIFFEKGENVRTNRVFEAKTSFSLKRLYSLSKNHIFGAINWLINFVLEN